jgi:UDP-2-acetamido-2-deoxy-ribo-hexuluronate aminotransferase
MVPFIDLKRFEDGFLERWSSKVARMTRNAEFIGGPEISNLETRLCEITQTKYAVSCANGTDAIQLALRSINVEQGDLVLIPNATFWATFEAVVNVGAKPVTVDIDYTDGGIDVNALSESIAKFKPRAAVIAHLYGWGSAKLLLIRQICRDNNVLLVEDGAQCFGVEIDGESIYKNALISTTSFYPAKVLGAAGDGGAVFSNEKNLADKARRLSNHGRSAHYSYSDVGWNSRLDAFQAAYLNLALDYLQDRLNSRRASAMLYKRLLADLGVLQMVASPNYLENGYCNVCLIENKEKKDKLEALLKQSGIGFANIYPGAMAKQPGAEKYLFAHVGGNNSEKLSASVLNLPLFPYMTDDEHSQIKTLLESFF